MTLASSNRGGGVHIQACRRRKAAWGPSFAAEQPGAPAHPV